MQSPKSPSSLRVLKQNQRDTMQKNQTTSMDIETAQKKQDEPPVVYRGWKVMPFIIGNEILEKLGIIGALTNLLIYLTTVFNMKSITAATIINAFAGTTNFGTFITAFLCDTYFGRYMTLGFAIISCFLGSLVVELTSAVKSLHPPQCKPGSICKGPTEGQVAFLMLGLGFLVVGAGGIRPCNLPFGADQFNPKTEAGKKGINSFFNWYFFVYTLAQMISVTLVVYVQSNVNWTIGLLIPVIFMFVGIIVFFSGSKLYVKVKASGSPLLSITQVIIASIKKRRLKTPTQPSISLYNYIPVESMNSKLAHTDHFRCLDKAAIMVPEDRLNDDGSPADPWRLCSMQQVEELKCLVRITPVWITASVYYVAIVQQSTYAIFQALQTDRHLGGSRSFEIPAASFTAFLMLGITGCLLVYERFLIPLLERITGRKGGITLLQRVGIGIFISILSSLISAFVEIRRRNIALTKPTLGMSKRGAISSMSGFWLIPQLVIAGAAEAFGDVGQLEFFYKQFPENMRSISGSVFYCGIGLSSYLSSFMISIVHRVTKNSATGNWLPEDLNKGRLEYFYFLITGIGILNFCCFLACSKWYKYRKISSNNDAEEIAAAKN